MNTANLKHFSDDPKFRNLQEVQPCYFHLTTLEMLGNCIKNSKCSEANVHRKLQYQTLEKLRLL